MKYTERSQGDEDVGGSSDDKCPSHDAMVLLSVGILDNVGDQEVMYGVGHYKGGGQGDRLNVEWHSFRA